MALVAHLGLVLHKMDVKRTLLNGDLEEEVNTKQPKVFSSSDGDNWACKLKKSTYVLKQASHSGILYFILLYLHLETLRTTYIPQD